MAARTHCSAVDTVFKIMRLLERWRRRLYVRVWELWTRCDARYVFGDLGSEDDMRLALFTSLVTEATRRYTVIEGIRMVVLVEPRVAGETRGGLSSVGSRVLSGTLVDFGCIWSGLSGGVPTVLAKSPPFTPGAG